jgi:hypothetical protein
MDTEPVLFGLTALTAPRLVALALVFAVAAAYVERLYKRALRAI